MIHLPLSYDTMSSVTSRVWCAMRYGQVVVTEGAHCSFPNRNNSSVVKWRARQRKQTAQSPMHNKLPILKCSAVQLYFFL